MIWKIIIKKVQEWAFGMALLTVVEIIATIIAFISTYSTWDSVYGAPQQTAVCAIFISWVLMCILFELVVARMERAAQKKR